MSRVYLDWNATAPLRAEARDAMMAAMDVTGNPSSVHAEGRAARAIVEKARAQVAALVGCDPSEVVFTSGATEAAALAIAADAFDTIAVAIDDHDAVTAKAADTQAIVLEHDGMSDHVDPPVRLLGGPASATRWRAARKILCSVPAASGETGGATPLTAEQTARLRGGGALVLRDATQAIARGTVEADSQVVTPCTRDTMGAPDFVLLSAHKFGGAKGTGALILRAGLHVSSPGGGQEMGRRSGTENIVGIAACGAAAQAALRDRDQGVWDRVAHLRNILEDALAEAAPDAIFVGRDMPRLPNTSCVITPGWAGETQVMQMDLAGFAISAGSACASGKVRESRVLARMGFDRTHATSAIRISLGPTTREAEVLDFVQAWRTAYARRRSRAA